MLPEKQPLHISQALNIQATEGDLDFFDGNLAFDSLLFIDPFLVKISPVEAERVLFDRFGIFFKHAYEQTLRAKFDQKEIASLLHKFSFKEPKEINLGYTQGSNQGSGLASSFASILIKFFLHHAASSILIKESNYPDSKINPNIFAIVSDGLGSDGISDLSGCLLMDYLIEYTQEQCRKYGVAMKHLPVRQTFDYEVLEWTNGVYAELPENPLRQGEPIVFVPKRFLRAEEPNNAKSKIVGILSADPHLNERFASLLMKKLSDISLQEVIDAVMKDEEAETIIQRYIKQIETDGTKPYDFNKDVLYMMAIKKFDQYFNGKIKSTEPKSCDDLLMHTQALLDEFDKELSARDGWKEQWYENDKKRMQPNQEVVLGKCLRAMGYAYFKHLPHVTFAPESDTGNGCVDFCIIHKDCKITIELKKLMNNTQTGEDKLPAYLHGIQKQLPEYSILMEATYAFYVTGQHFKETVGKRPRNHTYRTEEIKKALPNAELLIQRSVPHFKKLFYINIDLSPRPSASKL